MSSSTRRCWTADLFTSLQLDKPLNTPAFALLIDPFRIGWQISRQRPKSPRNFFFCVGGHLSILQHIPHRDRPLWSPELCVERQIAHGQNCQRLVDVTFKPVWMIERMSAATVGGFLKPRLVLEHRPGLDPLQPVDGLPVVIDQEVLSQSQQTVHHLPRCMVGRIQQTLPLDFSRLVDQLYQRIVAFQDSSGSRTNWNLVRALWKNDLRFVFRRLGAEFV